jgi:hypothetical protein
MPRLAALTQAFYLALSELTAFAAAAESPHPLFLSAKQRLSENASVLRQPSVRHAPFRLAIGSRVMSDADVTRLIVRAAVRMHVQILRVFREFEIAAMVALDEPGEREAARTARACWNTLFELVVHLDRALRADRETERRR